LLLLELILLLSDRPLHLLLSRLWHLPPALPALSARLLLLPSLRSLRHPLIAIVLGARAGRRTRDQSRTYCDRPSPSYQPIACHL